MAQGRGRFVTGRHGALDMDTDEIDPGEPGMEPFPRPAGETHMSPGTNLTVGPHGNPMSGDPQPLRTTPDPAITSGQPAQGTVAESPYVEPMTDAEILAVIDAELSNCAAQYSGELAENRNAALRYYEGRMEQAPKGRSQAVSTDVADVIEWTLPQVVNALMHNDNVALFEAVSEEDEQQAQLETDACEHVLWQENEGFIYLYSCAKDALLQKNCVGKVFWEERTEVEKEEYQGLTQIEARMLLQPQDGTQVRPTGYQNYVEPNIIDQLTGEPMQLWDLQVSRYVTNRGCRVLPLPPEEFLVNRDHNSVNLREARFTAHKRLVTESELIAEGWPQDLVRDLPTYSVDETGEREERRSLEDEKDFGYDASDRAVRRIQQIECYARIDQDRDGFAEMLKVDVAGSGSYYMMGWEPIHGNPFVGGTGILLSHKFYGRSLYDRCKEIQDQKTEVLRQIQDNLKHQNNSRTLVVAGQVNLDDLLTSRPGGVVRQKAPGMVEQLVAPQIGELGYRHLDYLDMVRTGRSGVSPDTASVVNAVAGDTAHGLERLMSAKEELTGLIIQLLADTLYKGTLVLIRGVLQRHRTSPMSFKVRGKWQQVNPAEWRSRTGVEVCAHLATGDRTKRMTALTAVLDQQQRAVEHGGLGTLVTEKNIYHTVTEFVRSSHLGDASPYWTDPDSPEAQQARAQQEQQRQQQEQQAQQQGMLLMQSQMAIEENKQLTQRMKIQSEELQAQQKLLQEMTEKAQDLKLAYTELELQFRTDIKGEGQEPAAEPGPGAATEGAG